jgi:phosphohistidine phosphatase SixA
MKRLTLLGLLILIVSLLLPANPVLAQDGDEENGPCAVATIHAGIDAAIAQYELRRGADGSGEAAINSAELLQLAIDRVIEDCEAQLEAERLELAKELLVDLRAGGYVLYVRHTHTDRSRGDTDLSSCDTQRILSERGRDEARMIAGYWEGLEIPVSRLVSTEYCRTRETAELAFGDPEIIERSRLRATLENELATEPAPGTNTMIVAHIGTLEGATGLVVGVDVTFNEGDTLVFEPLGDGQYAVYGYIGLDDWELLARAAEELALDME